MYLYTACALCKYLYYAACAARVHCPYEHSVQYELKDTRRVTTASQALPGTPLHHQKPFLHVRLMRTPCSVHTFRYEAVLSCPEYHRIVLVSTEPPFFLFFTHLVCHILLVGVVGGDTCLCALHVPGKRINHSLALVPYDFFQRRATKDPLLILFHLPVT